MIFYFLLVLIGSLIAGRLILGELRKERRDYIPVSPQDIKPTPYAVIREQDLGSSFPAPSINEPGTLIQERIVKVERLLVEKNEELKKLQHMLEAERKHKNDFEKIKNLLEWQVFESRQMNKEIKRELAALSIQGKQFEDEASKLKNELTFKEQVLAQSESKILELKNRLRGFLSTDSAPISKPHTQSEAGPKEESFDEFDWRTKLGE